MLSEVFPQAAVWPLMQKAVQCCLQGHEKPLQLACLSLLRGADTCHREVMQWGRLRCHLCECRLLACMSPAWCSMTLGRIQRVAPGMRP